MPTSIQMDPEMQANKWHMKSIYGFASTILLHQDYRKNTGSPTSFALALPIRDDPFANYCKQRDALDQESYPCSEKPSAKGEWL
jgi:hypothetical protein